MATATETRKPIAVGHCSSCGYTYKTTLRSDTAQRKIVTCPECGDGRIIARKLKKQEAPSGQSDSDNKQTAATNGKEKEGQKGGEVGEQETSDESANKDGSTLSKESKEEEEGKPKKRSSVRKVENVTVAKRRTRIQGSGNGRTGKPAGKSTGKRRASSATPTKPRKRTQTADTSQDRPTESHEEEPADSRWEGLYAGIY